MTDKIKLAVNEFGALKFFPADESARTAVMKLLQRMVTTPEQLAWLVRTMIDEVGEWHGTRELRGVFCSHYWPRAGIEASCATTPGFTADALEAKGSEQHENLKCLGAGSSLALLPIMRKLPGGAE